MKNDATLKQDGKGGDKVLDMLDKLGQAYVLEVTSRESALRTREEEIRTLAWHLTQAKDSLELAVKKLQWVKENAPDVWARLQEVA